MVGNGGAGHDRDGRYADASNAPLTTQEDVSATQVPPLVAHQEHDVSLQHGGDLHLDIPHLPMAAEIALGALSTLPTPLIVLSSLKTILLANAALGRLLDIGTEDGSVTALLRGQTLSQIGIDMVSEGVPIWVSWDKFLDNVAAGVSARSPDDDSQGEVLPGFQSGETTPIAHSENIARGRTSSRPRTNKAQDTIVDVVVTSKNIGRWSKSGRRRATIRGPGVQATCRMIISIWTLDSQRFFTLTFTSNLNHPNKPQWAAHPTHRTPSTNSAKSSRSSQSHTPSSSTSGSAVTSPAELGNKTDFPPTGAPANCSPPSAFTDFQKIIKMKNAMLNAMNIPVLAMWRDESVVFPNPAARRLLAVNADPTTDDSYDFVSRFSPWAADFSRPLEEIDNPIIALCRTQKAFDRWQIGLVNETTGKKTNWDVSGHPVHDEKTGEFLAGLIAFKDVTEYTEELAMKAAENEEQFRQICDMMPQMLWTTRPDGYHDYFSQRWYDFTGLNPANSLGLGWRLPFHEEDMPESSRRWANSLATGDEYRTQYRCRRYDGEWRWMLGRALPLRDRNTGHILKWIGTCTDIQDIMDAKLEGHRARHNLLEILRHSQMSMWITDRDGKITFFEGDFITEEVFKSRFLGKPIYEMLGASKLCSGDHGRFLEAVRKTLDGESTLEVCEIEVEGRWFRSKMVPLKGKRGANMVEEPNFIAGVIGIGTEVTQLRNQELANIKLLANETAAKEASKMKSSFLANMSHEIRTPIAGVLGMSELLMDTRLDIEQADFAQNIQRSANSLLTVINDILDFSKIESGRLDVEEVQFSLRVVLEDVTKMLSFAAQRKGLSFHSEINLGTSDNLILLGDPGRVRQILTNLLTNSIKFTSEGWVRMSCSIVKDQNDTSTVEFCIEDTGIGIEEEVKKKLFKPFSQADSSTARRFGGTGLGLTISKNLVDLMHGTICLESKLGAGTTATFCIPFKKPEYISGSTASMLDSGAIPDRLQSELSLSIEGSSKGDPKRKISPPPIKAASSLNATRGSSMMPSTTTSSVESDVQRELYHILVVEDNPVNQKIAIRSLRTLKFSASAVWNGREALEYLLKATSPDLTPDQARDYPVPSIILMDVQMPILDGYRATHMLRHHEPFTSIPAICRLPIVAMTASAIQGDREKCERAGMDDYMAKPVKRALLEKTILKWISTGRSEIPSKTHGDTAAKPTFARASTGHSSNCTEHDNIAAEFLAKKSPTVTSPMPLLAAAESDLSVAAGQAIARRTSFSQSLLAGDIVYNEGDRSLKRAELEDKAQSLRDAKLLGATDVNMDVLLPSTTSGSPQGIGPKSMLLALTEENISKFNQTHDGHLDVAAADTHVQHSIDIPGPPPDEVLTVDELRPTSVGVGNIDDARYIKSIVKNSHSKSDVSANAGEGVGLEGPKTRREIAMALGRNKSDWSTSTGTAKPELEK